MTLQFLALVIGPLFVAIYLPSMLYPHAITKFAKSFAKEDLLVRICGGIVFLLGMVILNVEYRLAQDWEALMVLLGYGSVLKGLVYMWWPDSIKKVLSKYSVRSFGLLSAMGFILGVALCYLGAYVY